MASGHEIYLWYNNESKKWLLAEGSNFEARNKMCYMYFMSQEHDVKKLDSTWFEAINDEYIYTMVEAIVTIS